jgi:putative oxidoreductase
VNTGLLILRVVLGLLLAGHGSQKLFGWMGGPGLSGTARMFESLGFRPGRAAAWAGGLAEFVGGLALALGWFTPFAAALIVGMMGNAITAVHWPNGIWAQSGGIEFPLTNAAAALAVAFIGPGRFSLDHGFGWHLYGWKWGVAALVIGALGVLAGMATRATAARAGSRTTQPTA